MEEFSKCTFHTPLNVLVTERASEREREIGCVSEGTPVRRHRLLDTLRPGSTFRLLSSVQPSLSIQRPTRQVAQRGFLMRQQSLFSTIPLVVHERSHTNLIQRIDHMAQVDCRIAIVVDLVKYVVAEQLEQITIASFRPTGIDSKSAKNASKSARS